MFTIIGLILIITIVPTLIISSYEGCGTGEYIKDGDGLKL